MLGTDHYFPPGGNPDWKKNCLHEKNAEINCLPQRCIWKKVVCRDHLCYARFGEFKIKKKLSAQPKWRKKLASAQSMVEKISCLLEITIPPPPPGGNNGTSLKRSYYQRNPQTSTLQGKRLISSVEQQKILTEITLFFRASSYKFLEFRDKLPCLKSEYK